nr:DUF4350 domain-containing protein [Symbiobacterium thermophilum]
MFVSVLFGGDPQPRARLAPAGSSWAQTPEGLSAIYAVLADQGAARRWTLPLDRLDGSVDRLVVWNVDGLDPDEVDALEAWVFAGGTALVGGPLSGFRGTFQPAAEGTARPAAPHPATLGIRAVSVGSGRFGGAPGERLIHLKDEEGRPVLVSWRVGEGRIFWSADTAWLSNARIGEAQNLDLALQILLPPDGGQVAFDEYHHGFVAPTHWWQVLRGSLQAFGLMLAAAVALLFWSYGARFGSPLPAPERPPRAAVEYVHSMSRLYRRVGARAVVLRALHRSLRTELSRLTGGAEGLSHGEIAGRAAARCGVPAGEIERLLERTADLNHIPADAELIDLARQAEKLRRRIEHATYRDG